MSENENVAHSAGAALKRLRLRADLSVRAMAEKLGLKSHSTYNGWEVEYKRPYMTWDRVQQLASILVGLGDPAIRQEDVYALAGLAPDKSRKGHVPAPPELRPAPEVKMPAVALMPRDVPVYGTAAGSNGDGAFLFSQQDVVDYVRRPAGLAANRNAYGVYVEGDSMEPALYQGDLIIADPSRKPRPGDRVVIVCAAGDHDGDGQTAFVKEFVRQTTTHLTVKQFNPPREIVFDRARVASVHRVLTTADLMGV